MRCLMSCLLGLSLIGCSGQIQQNTAPPKNISNHSYQADESMTQKEQTELNSLFSNTNNSNSMDKKQDDSPSTNKQKIILDVPIIKQLPELQNGCEVTSLAMVLQYTGIKVDKMELAKQVPKDKDPVSKNKKGDIINWGNPNHGFVGDITGKNIGFAIYAKPLETLMNRYLPDRTVNLTGKAFEALLQQVENQKPVLVWTTGDFKTPDRRESWNHGVEKIQTALDLHVVVLTGFDSDYVYVNDPLTGGKNQKVNKQSFILSWNELGKQALSYR